MDTFKTLFLSLCAVTLFQGCAVVYSQHALDQGSLSTNAMQVLDQHCSKCHGQNSPQLAGIDFITDPAALVKYRLVIPGDPDNSMLYTKVVTGMEPPSPEETLNKDELATLYYWIESLDQ